MITHLSFPAKQALHGCSPEFPIRPVSMGKPASLAAVSKVDLFMSKGSWWNPERWWLEDDCTFLLGLYYFQGLLLLNFRWVKVWVCVCIVSKHFFKARSLMNYQLHFWEGWEPDSSWSFCISTIYIINQTIRMIFRQPNKKGNQSIRSRIVFCLRGPLNTVNIASLAILPLTSYSYPWVWSLNINFNRVIAVQK